MKSTLALFASSRRHGNTGRLLDLVAERSGIEIVDLAQLDLSPFDYAHNNRHDDFEPLMSRVLAVDQVLFASPIYWYAVAPAMKIFLDRISDYLDIPELLDQGRRLRGKTGFVLCTSVYEEPDNNFIGAFRQMFAYLGMQDGGCLHANCKSGLSLPALAPAIDSFIALLQDPHGVAPAAAIRS